MTFNAPKISEWLDANPADNFDSLSFGVVKMDYNGFVVSYSHSLYILTGVSKENAVGKHFFTQVAPCTNNFMIAEKYKLPELDETLPYMFTYITKPTPVELRLIKGSNGNQYMLAKKA